MNDISYGFQSPLLAQKKLLEFFRGKNQSNNNYATIDANHCRNKMAPILTAPQFHRDFLVSYEEAHNPSILLRELLVRASKGAYKKILSSKKGNQASSKVIRYDIPFDSQDVDFSGSNSNTVAAKEEIIYVIKNLLRSKKKFGSEQGIF